MSAFKSGLSDRSIGLERRAKFGTGPLYIEAEPPPKPRWICDLTGCTRWTEGDGSDGGGVCSGYCLAF